MKKKFYPILFFFLPHICLAQINLVPNYSFEVYDTCPNTYSQIYYAIPWFSSLPCQCGSSDYYNACAGGPLVSVPSNGGGYQNARTGVGYAGIEFGGGGSCWCGNLREYIEVKLDSQLVSRFILKNLL